MMPPSNRAAEWLRTSITTNNLIAPIAASENLRRLRWTVLVVVPLTLVYALIFWFRVPADTARELAWKNAIGWTHFCMAVWLLAPGLAALLLRHRPDPGLWGRVLQLVVPVSLMLFSIALTLIDQWVTPNISPFLLGVVFTSLLFLLRPSVAIVLFLSSFALFYLGIGLAQADPVQLLSNRINGLTSAVMGIVLSMLLWHQNTVNLMLQRELGDRNTALVQQQQELLWLAKRDALTGLFNRGEFLHLAELELLRAQRHASDTSVIMLDLDYFKKINDTYGHPAGDSVLKHAATCVLEGVRATDVAGRIGGEEFMVLLPQTSLDAAMVLAEKLLGALRQSPARITSDLQLNITASFGVSSVQAGQHGTVVWLYAAADHAMYEAKRRGRNRVEKTVPDPSLTPSDFQRMRRH